MILENLNFPDADTKSMEVEQIEEKIEATTISDDGVFKVTLGPTPSSSVNETSTLNSATKLFNPSPRINSGLAIKHGTLYLYGGMFEDGDKQITFNDLYSVDLKKLDEWKTLIPDDMSTLDWLGSDSEEGEDSGGEEDESDDDNDEEDSDDSEMDTC